MPENDSSQPRQRGWLSFWDAHVICLGTAATVYPETGIASMPAANTSDRQQPISGHKERDQYICAILTRDDLLTPLELRVAVRLGIFFNCKTGQCDPGYARLAKELCISPRSARRCVAALVAYGFVGRDEGAGGSHDQKRNFSLFMPPARGTDSVSPVRRTDSVSPVETEEQDQHGGQKHGETGDQNKGVRGTIRRPTKEPEEPEEPDSAALRAAHTADAARYSTTNTAVDAPLTPAKSTVDDAPVPATDSPVPRADARTEPITAQQQPPSSASENIGRPAANGVNADADAERAAALDYGRKVLGAGSDALTARLLDAERALDAFGAADRVLEALDTAANEDDPHAHIENEIAVTQSQLRQLARRQ